jgi:hypothetical protein
MLDHFYASGPSTYYRRPPGKALYTHGECFVMFFIYVMQDKKLHDSSSHGKGSFVVWFYQAHNKVFTVCFQRAHGEESSKQKG